MSKWKYDRQEFQKLKQEYFTAEWTLLEIESSCDLLLSEVESSSLHGNRRDNGPHKKNNDIPPSKS